MAQTADDVKNSTVKIVDNDRNFGGTGFFIHKEYCITCHHNIAEMDKIYVAGEDDKLYLAKWIEDYSDMEKDVAILRVKGSKYKPLEYQKVTYPGIDVVARGFPKMELHRLPAGRPEPGSLSETTDPMRWEKEEIEGSQKWNKKPERNLDVYIFSGDFDVGFSGGPVCYKGDWKVVGMFDAKDNTRGYVIPIEVVMSKFRGENQLAAPISTPITTQSFMQEGNNYFLKEQYNKAIEYYDLLINDRNYANAWHNKGLSLELLGYHKKAIDCFDKSIEMEPLFAQAWNNKGVSIGNLRKHDKEAIRCFNKSINIDPNNSTSWYNKGNALIRLGKYKEAIECYDRSLEIDPTNIEVRTSRREADKKFGKHKEPIELITPSYVLIQIAEKGDYVQRSLALQTLTTSEKRYRSGKVAAKGSKLTIISDKRRFIYDANYTGDLPGNLVRSEGHPDTGDPAIDEAYNSAGITYDFYKNVYGRNSVDNKGLEIIITAHYLKNFSNAFWNGNQVVCGDGDGNTFQGFTKSIDMMGHTLTHGIIQYEGNLTYQGQSGALSEHFCDVFGSLIKQWYLKQTASEADWLLGEGVFTSKIRGKALRSMKEPGTAYDDPLIGKDPQPDHMSRYVNTSTDNGGIHMNCGIPNRAFYLIAVELGGYAWERVGKIWYTAMTERIQKDLDFYDIASTTLEISRNLFGVGSIEEKAVQRGWEAVGIRARKTKK
jgi:Zn-dependent metalloprotease